MTANFWSTVEVDSWSRDFGYEEYLNFHALSGTTGKVLSHDAYDALSDILHIEMEDSFK